MELTAKRVDEFFIKCLFKDSEVIEGRPIMEPIKAEGIFNTFGFHPERLANHKDLVIKLLRELPSEFFRDVGGGWSFLNACYDKHGNQWGEHRNIEQLFCLAIALKIAMYSLPRKLWPALPGGMPYVTLLIAAKEGNNV